MVAVRVCLSQAPETWPLSLPGWDIDIDQIECVAHIELTVGICRVSYLGTYVIKSIVGILY